MRELWDVAAFCVVPACNALSAASSYTHVATTAIMAPLLLLLPHCSDSKILPHFLNRLRLLDELQF